MTAAAVSLTLGRRCCMAHGRSFGSLVPSIIHSTVPHKQSFYDHNQFIQQHLHQQILPYFSVLVQGNLYGSKKGANWSFSCVVWSELELQQHSMEQIGASCAAWSEQELQLCSVHHGVNWSYNCAAWSELELAAHFGAIWSFTVLAV